MSRIYTVLFLCTANSARSILGEPLLHHMGRGGFRAYSAGSHPRGEVYPKALEVLRKVLRAIGRSDGATGKAEVC